MDKYLINEDLISETEEILLLNAADNQDIYLIDPKTLGVLETYTDEGIIGSKSMVISSKYGIYFVFIKKYFLCWIGHIVGFQNEKNVFNLWNINGKKTFAKAGCLEKLACAILSKNELYYIGGS